MNAVAILDTQFVQVALPLMVTLSIAAWWNNKRVDDLRTEIRDFRAEVRQSVAKIEDLLLNHEKRIVTLEERTSLTRR